MMDETHDPSLRSWVESAEAPGTDFPIQNLPFGVFERLDAPGSPRQGVAIGEMILDLTAAATLDVIPGIDAAQFRGPLNSLMAWSASDRRHLRRELQAVLSADTARGAAAERLAPRLLVAQRDARLLLPATVGDYSDFYASVHHATNVGSMFRPDNPLLPNYKWVPIGYHGRASSIVVSGTPVPRPLGQVSAAPAGPPSHGASARLDYEVELGFWIAGANALGTVEPIGTAGERLFGVSLLNDWSARDIQAWEYQPLGPFLAKSFATTVAPWVVTAEALAPFRVPAAPRPPGDPAPLPYLTDAGDQAAGGLAITIEVWLRTVRMRDAGLPAARLSTSDARDLYWTPAQMIAHHASNGCNLRPGDLLGSGTISGPARESRGCLLELAWRGSEPVPLPSGETRAFLADGDEVTFRGRATRTGYRDIGFGTCSGIILPASS